MKPTRPLVGVHGRNAVDWRQGDFDVLHAADIEAVKMMSHTRGGIFERIRNERPGILFITRLYDDRFGVDSRPSPAAFAEKMIPVITSLRPWCVDFQVLNEPNHLHRYEGWGQEDYYARDFNAWFISAYNYLKGACPWASFGFPGLAIPHRDFEWLDICRPAIELADWLGCHTYWQTPPGQENNHLADFWGLRFKAYHAKYPDKVIHILEAGNSNNQAWPPIPLPEPEMARQITEHLRECFKYDYLGSVSYFILSSPDPSWFPFAWRDESGRRKEVVRAVGGMDRTNGSANC